MKYYTNFAGQAATLLDYPEGTVGVVVDSFLAGGKTFHRVQVPGLGLETVAADRCCRYWTEEERQRIRAEYTKANA